MDGKQKDAFLEKTKIERESRLAEKKKHDSALKIQKWMCNVTAKQKELRLMRKSIDVSLGDEKSATRSGLELFQVGQKLLFLFDPRKDNERFKTFCKLLLSSMESNTAKAWYVSVSVDKTNAIAWIKQVKKVLVKACNYLRGVKPGLPKDDAILGVYLNVIVLFTDYTLWKFSAKAGTAMKPTLNRLCSTFISCLCDADFYAVMHELLLNGLGCAEPKLSKHALPATMGIRALALQRFPPEMMTSFTQFILSAPASMLHLHRLAPETIRQLEKAGFTFRLISNVTTESLAGLDSNTSLCIFANFVYLSSLNVDILAEKRQLNCLLKLLTRLIEQCLSGRSLLNSSTANWHPFFGWCKESSDNRISHSAVHIRTQLQCLWSGTLMDYLYSPVLALTPTCEARNTKGKAKFSLFKKPPSFANVDDAVIRQVCSVCSLYDCCRQSLTQIASDILIGLGCNSNLVKKLWHFVRSVIGLDVSRIAVVLSEKNELSKVLSMTCQVTQYLLAILDDEELIVQQQHFTTEELVDMASFLNRLVFKLIWDELDAYDVLSASHELLILLYNKDARKSFMGIDMWLIRSFKFSGFLSDFKSAKPKAVELMSRIPHVIPHKKRVEFFYDLVHEEKSRLGLTRSHLNQTPATYISVHRNRILEDGFIQLSLLPSKTLKGTIRVKFINEQGLDEAGIDETGVFKEYLEETMKKAFNPALNLFKVNSVGHIYPSPTSHVHENHLSLFEFIGKMLGKAVFEGIVVEVPFAPFFLSQMLEHHRSALYSCFDELPSMDPELYKSLSYIKHCEEDVEDLCLTFSWDEEFLGKTISHELVPGGCVTPVTNQNRISYVHRMANFRMRTQIKEQASAFIKGFHSVINKSWVACFSPHELQRLISGDEVELDVNDLRGHTQYFGGYHDNHKVILWLWDVIKNEFTADEKSAFLKFVTSCSKPPLLGFSNLEPPFAIRCVQVPEEQDTGDSLGSVLRGFFSVRQRGAKDRLPTASTCFNLLKLPNYRKKSILRDKLRYAISANAGFELS